MRVLITGSAGQLGLELLRAAAPGSDVIGLSREECDITNARQLNEVFRAHCPALVINAAAYTSVDAAEDRRELAQAVNATGAGSVARVAADLGARMIHISTDYVFDGSRRDPYPTDAVANPINVYGRTKLAGEHEVLRQAPEALIIRSGWIYSSHGRNFLLTILAALRSGRTLRIVSDQTGVPTAARDLARAVWKTAQRPDITGVRHWVNGGSASWYEFGIAIQRQALEIGLIASEVPIFPVTTEEYGAPAPRPSFSVLDATDLWRTLGEQPLNWRDALAQTLAELRGDPTSAGRPPS